MITVAPNASVIGDVQINKGSFISYASVSRGEPPDFFTNAFCRYID